jgi:hypothetical protein
MAKKNTSASKIFFSGLLGGVLGLVFSPVIFLVVAFHSIRLLGNPDFDNKALLKNTLVLLVFSPIYCLGIGLARGATIPTLNDQGILENFNLFGLFSRTDIKTDDFRGLKNPLLVGILLDRLEGCIKEDKESDRSDTLKNHNGYSKAQIPLAFGVVAAGVVFALVMTAAFSPLLPVMVGVATGYIALATAGVVLGAAVLVSAGMWGVHKITSRPAQTDSQKPVSIDKRQTQKPAQAMELKAVDVKNSGDVTLHKENEEKSDEPVETSDNQPSAT